MVRKTVKEMIAGVGTSDTETSHNGREQEILTPQYILDAIKQEIGPIVLDPCANKGNNTGAAKFYTAEDDGLTRDWRRDVEGYDDPVVFMNPPYGPLKEWLKKADDETLENSSMIVVSLIPVRTNRRWFCDYAFLRGRYAYLPPVRFVGYGHDFPAPLMLHVASGLDIVTQTWSTSLGNRITWLFNRLKANHTGMA